MILDGNYAGGVVFNATTVVSVERFTVKDGNSYSLTLNNATNTSELLVDATALTGANKLTLNGSAETTSSLTALGGDGNDALIGGGGADTLIGNGGADQLTGNGGIDTADYSGSAAGVTVDLGKAVAQVSAGDASGDVLSGIENVIGTGDIDALTGDGNANRLTGLAGADTLDGAGGNDVLEGGAAGDILSGGAGNDTASYESAGGGVVASLDGSLVHTGDALGDVYDSIENLTGSDFADTLAGNGNANRLDGGSNADTLIGNCGIDTLNGGDGADILDLGHDLTALDRIDGGDGYDKLTVDGNYALGVVFTAATMVNVDEIAIADGNSYKFTLVDANNVDDLTIDGSVLTGSNWLSVNAAAEASKALLATGGSGADTLIGGKGDDVLAGGNGNDTLTGNDGIDDLDGGAGNDNLNGGNGNDLIAIGAGIDTVVAGAGDDNIDAGSFLTSAERIDGGLGTDVLTLAGDYAVGVTFTTTTVTNIETILLTDGNSYKLTLNDATTAAAAQLTVDGSALTGGNAMFVNGALEKSGSLVLIGGDGADTLTGGGGIDAFGGSKGADVMNGGANTDIVSYENSDAGVTIDLTLAGAQGGGGDGAGDILSNIENLVGSTFADRLTGNAQVNFFIGGDGGDTIDGGAGNDTVEYLGSDTGVTVDLTLGTQGGSGHAAGDQLLNIENLVGSDLDDALTGDDKANQLEGRAGIDTLFGGAGNDVLLGGDDGDLLVGGDGSDKMTGGAGSDRFAWEAGPIVGLDTITDFTFSDILDISDLVVGFVEDVSKITDFVRFVASGNNTVVQIDADGAVGGSDFVSLATLTGVTGPSANVNTFFSHGNLDATGV